MQQSVIVFIDDDTRQSANIDNFLSKSTKMLHVAKRQSAQLKSNQINDLLIMLSRDYPLIEQVSRFDRRERQRLITLLTSDKHVVLAVIECPDRVDDLDHTLNLLTTRAKHKINHISIITKQHQNDISSIKELVRKYNAEDTKVKSGLNGSSYSSYGLVAIITIDNLLTEASGSLEISLEVASH